MFYSIRNLQHNSIHCRLELLNVSDHVIHVKTREYESLSLCIFIGK